MKITPMYEVTEDKILGRYHFTATDTVLKAGWGPQDIHRQPTAFFFGRHA